MAGSVHDGAVIEKVRELARNSLASTAIEMRTSRSFGPSRSHRRPNRLGPLVTTPLKSSVRKNANLD